MKISSKLIHNLLSYVAQRQTNKQIDKQTNKQTDLCRQKHIPPGGGQLEKLIWAGASNAGA